MPLKIKNKKPAKKVIVQKKSETKKPVKKITSKKAPTAKRVKRTEPVARTATERQKKLLSLITQNLGREAEGKPSWSLEKMMIDAGYSPTTARKQSEIMRALPKLPESANIVDRMKAHRDLILSHMEAKIPLADYSALARAMDTISKHVELLDGNPTDRTEHVVPDAERDRVKRLINS